MNCRISFFILLAAFAFNGFSQTKEQMLKKARELYNEIEYRDAIALLNEYIASVDDNPEAFILRGDCYIESWQIERAKADYEKAYELDATHTAIYERLGHWYVLKEDYKSAASYLEKYVELVPDDEGSVLELALCMRELGEKEKAILHYEKAFSLDSSYLGPVRELIWLHFSNGNMPATIRWAKKAKEMNEESQFYYAHGLALEAQGKYKEAKTQMDLALKIDPYDISAIDMKLELEMIVKTDHSLLNEDKKGRLSFKEYTSENLRKVLKKGNFRDFDSLLERMKQGEVLALDEYIRIYLGQSFDPGFDVSNAKGDKEIDRCYAEGNYGCIVSIGDRVFTNRPLVLQDIYRVAEAHFGLDNLEQFYRYYTAYQGLLMSIKLTGTGINHEQAYVIVTSKDGQELLQRQRQNIVNLSSDKVNDNSYSIYHVEDHVKNEIKVFFNKLSLR